MTDEEYHACVQCKTTKTTQEQVHRNKQQGDAKETFPSTTDFSEKQWQFSVIYFVHRHLIFDLYIRQSLD